MQYHFTTKGETNVTYVNTIPKHPMDKPYPPEVLDLIRTHLHRKIVSKLTTFQKDDYLIVFDESSEEDMTSDTIRFQAGKPFTVCLCVSPMNGIKVGQMTHRAFRLPMEYLKKFMRYYALVRKSDAVGLYGLEVSGQPTALDTIKEELKRYKKFTTKEIFVSVKVLDTETGRSVTVKQKNGNAFDIENHCIRLLRGGL